MGRVGTRARFVRNSAGVREVLSTMARAPVEAATQSAKSIAEGLSESGRARYRADVGVFGDRCVGLVGTTDYDSCVSNAKHNSLEKARRGARP